MPALGLDIGSSSIKLISLSGNEKKPRLEAFGLAINPVGNVDTENEPERVQIASAVKKLMEDVGVKQRKVVVGVAESKVFTRVIETPLLSESELASAITWEAEQYIPMPISEVQLDYRVVSQSKAATAETKMQVFLVAAPTNLVNKLVNLLELAGVEAEVVETEIVGVSRALFREVRVPAHLVVHLGAATTDLCISEGEAIVLTRSLPSGGNALTRSLATELGLEFAQAEQYKRSYGLDNTQLQGKVRAALLPMVSAIVSEVRKVMYFYTTNRQGKVSRVMLTGGGAYLPELVRELAREVGVEVVVGNPFLGVEMEARQQQRIGAISAVFAVAVGLAMRNL